jgi:spectinomycin phosphotransferase
VRSLPEGIRERFVTACLADGWGLEVDQARYAPVGFGSYHWEVTDPAGRRYFATVDDLDAKGWLGHDRDSSFDGLRAAFDTALALHRDAGLPFVVAPIPAMGGATVLRAASRYSIALFPFVEATGRSGMEHAPAERADVVALLADLHGATDAALPVARRRHLALPYRPQLEVAIRELDRPWTGGPLSEPVRELLADTADALQDRLRAFDQLAREVDAVADHFVVTHGEPHAGNVLRGAGRTFLVDWDTVGLAPPERDLWLVGGDAGELARYTDLTGRGVDSAAIDLYRRRWELDDIAAFTNVLRSAHERTADTEKAWNGLCHYLRAGTTPVRSQST